MDAPLGYSRFLTSKTNFENLIFPISYSVPVHGKNKEFLDENANHIEESSKLKPLANESDEFREKTLQEDLNLSSSSIEDFIMSDDEQ